MKNEDIPIIFTPDNEPYIGRVMLAEFDKMISAILNQNALIAPRTHSRQLSDLQKMACQIIPQAISIALSVRELARQGYLFGAHVLLRAFIERAAILQYIQLNPTEIDKWLAGWQIQVEPKAPSLAKMFDAILAKSQPKYNVRGSDLTANMNSLLHGKPDSAPWNLVYIGDGKHGFAPSKILERPDLCDDLCEEALPWLVGSYAS